MVSLLVAQVNLVFQTALIALIGVAVLFMRRKKILFHAQIMLAAVVLNVVSFLAVMAPSMGSLNVQVSASSAVAMLHGSIGVLALILGVCVVGLWLAGTLTNASAPRCYGSLNKKLMSATLFMWVTSLVFGYVLYALLFMK